MTVSAFKYDVAISLRGQDAALAQRLAKALAPLRVFVFTKRQQEIAGRSLVETFTEVFRRDALLGVVLYRQGWGETDYTNLESLAIQDRGLKTRWRSPLLVQLDDTAPPVWYPEVQAYLDYRIYGFTETVGAIRARAMELGAQPQPETALQRAKRLQAERSSSDARLQRLANKGPAAARAEAARLFAALTAGCEQLVGEVSELSIEHGLTAPLGPFILVSGQVSTSVVCEPSPGGVNPRPVLRVVEFRGALPVPGGDGRHYQGYDQIGERRYHIGISDADEWVWMSEVQADSDRPSATLADAILRRHVDRAFAGDPRPRPRRVARSSTWSVRPDDF